MRHWWRAGHREDGTHDCENATEGAHSASRKPAECQVISEVTWEGDSVEPEVLCSYVRGSECCGRHRVDGREVVTLDKCVT